MTLQELRDEALRLLSRFDGVNVTCTQTLGRDSYWCARVGTDGHTAEMYLTADSPENVLQRVAAEAVPELEKRAREAARRAEYEAWCRARTSDPVLEYIAETERAE